MKRLILIIISLVILIVSILGYNIVNSKFSKEAEKIYLDKYVKDSLAKTEPSILMKSLDANINKLSIDSSSKAVDGLLYSTYQHIPEMSKKLEILIPSIELLKKEFKDADINSTIIYKNVNDETLLGFLKEMNKRNLKIDYYEGDYIIHANIPLILKKYENYMKEDLKAVVKFSVQEDLEQFFIKEKNMFNLDLIVNRIILVENNLLKYKGSVYEKNMIDSRNYYLSIYFGANNDVLIDNNKKVLKDVISHYSKTIISYPNSNLAHDLKLLISKLEKTNYIVTDDTKVWLLDYTKSKTGIKN